MARPKIERPRLKEKKGRPFRVHYRYEGEEGSFSTGTMDWTEAEKILRRAEAFFDLGDDPAKANPNVDSELIDGPGSMPWENFRERYFVERVAGKKPRSIEDYRGAFNLAEQILTLRTIGDLANRDTLNRLKKSLSNGEGGKGRSRTNATVRSILAALFAGLNWAKEEELIEHVPKIRLPELSKGRKAKGRSLNGEEVDRYKDAIPKVVGEIAAPSWLRIVDGLICSGLRVSELMSLHWNDAEEIRPVRVGTSWSLHLPSDRHKGSRHEERPVPLEFAEMLNAVPKSERKGFVFNPVSVATKHGQKPRNGGKRPLSRWVSEKLVEAGKRAGIIVDPSTRKTASAHDLRRTRAQLLANAGVPIELTADVLGHRKLSTTRDYYLGIEAARKSVELSRIQADARDRDEPATPDAAIKTAEQALAALRRLDRDAYEATVLNHASSIVEDRDRSEPVPIGA